MSESKKVKFDSPDDMFLADPSGVHDIKPTIPPELGIQSNNFRSSVPSALHDSSVPSESTDAGMNIWDWKYWESL